MHGNSRMQHGRELAGAKTYATNRLSCFSTSSFAWRMLARGIERDPATVAGNCIARVRREPRHLCLNPLERRVHGANGSAGGSLFREHIPGLEGVTQFEFESLSSDRSDLRKAKLHVRCKPLLFEIVASPAQAGEHIEKVAPDKVREHKTIMQRGAPPYQASLEWTFPKHAYQRADEEHLDKTHSHMRSHFEGT